MMRRPNPTNFAFNFRSPFYVQVYLAVCIIVGLFVTSSRLITHQRSGSDEALLPIPLPFDRSFDSPVRVRTFRLPSESSAPSFFAAKHEPICRYLDFGLTSDYLNSSDHMNVAAKEACLSHSLESKSLDHFSHDFLMMLPSEDIYLYPQAQAVAKRAITQMMRLYGGDVTLPPIILDYNPAKRWLRAFRPKDQLANKKRNLQSTDATTHGALALDHLQRLSGDQSGELWLLPLHNTPISSTSWLPLLHSSTLIDCRRYTSLSLKTETDHLYDDGHASEDDISSMIILYPPIAGRFPKEVVDQGLDHFQSSGAMFPQTPKFTNTELRTVMATYSGLVARQHFNNIRLHLEGWYNNASFENLEDLGPLIWPFFAKMAQTPSHNHDAPERLMTEMIFDPSISMSTSSDDSRRQRRLKYHDGEDARGEDEVNKKATKSNASRSNQRKGIDDDILDSLLFSDDEREEDDDIDDADLQTIRDTKKEGNEGRKKQRKHRTSDKDTEDVDVIDNDAKGKKKPKNKTRNERKDQEMNRKIKKEKKPLSDDSNNPPSDQLRNYQANINNVLDQDRDEVIQAQAVEEEVSSKTGGFPLVRESDQSPIAKVSSTLKTLPGSSSWPYDQAPSYSSFIWDTPLQTTLHSSMLPPRRLTLYRTPGLSYWMPPHRFRSVVETLGIQGENGKDTRFQGTTYAVISLSSKAERQIVQEYLWGEQGYQVYPFQGLLFSDKEAIDDHFGNTLKKNDIWRLQTKDKAILLIQNHVLALRFACIERQGVGAVLIVEDDGVPSGDIRPRLERTIDVLQGYQGINGWGYHSTGAHGMYHVNDRLDAVIDNKRKELAKEYPSSLGLGLELGLPYIGDIGIISQPDTGTHGQIINCERFQQVHDQFFVDHDRPITPEQRKKGRLYNYLSPSRQFSAIKDKANHQEWKWRDYAADRHFKDMFWEFDPINSYGRPVRRAWRQFSTFNFDPLVTISVLEWNGGSTLHKNVFSETREEDVSVLLHGVKAAAHASMVNKGFPRIGELDDNKELRDYFIKHMHVPRKNLCRRAIFDWTREIIADRLRTSNVESHVFVAEDWSEVGRRLNSLLWILFRGHHHIEMEPVHIYNDEAQLPFEYDPWKYFPCLFGDSVPALFRDAKFPDDTVARNIQYSRRNHGHTSTL